MQDRALGLVVPLIVSVTDGGGCPADLRVGRAARQQAGQVVRTQAERDPGRVDNWSRFSNRVSRSLGDQAPPDGGVSLVINRPLMLMSVRTLALVPLHTENVFRIREILN